MDSRLNSDEIHALRSLDASTSSTGSAYRDGDLPQRLFAFNLVTRQASGTAVLTKTGERALFRQACLDALIAIDAQQSHNHSAGVHKWLLAGGFIDKGNGAAASPVITRMGRLWLASFIADADPVLPQVTGEDFARRRA